MANAGNEATPMAKPASVTASAPIPRRPRLAPMRSRDGSIRRRRVASSIAGPGSSAVSFRRERSGFVLFQRNRGRGGGVKLFGLTPQPAVLAQAERQADQIGDADQRQRQPGRADQHGGNQS